ncbi:MAG: class I SAM-dependent DNA methyltransferase [Halanaerobiales bacterium]
MSSFDSKAKKWDKDPGRRKRAREVAEGIRQNIKITPEMKALEYGCGTGLLSFQLHTHFDKIVLADISRGMLEVAEEKIAQKKVENMETRRLNLTEEPVPDETFDVIFTLMTLHHIKDIKGLLSKFNLLLSTSGYLCIADLVKEDGSFHGKKFEGHNGFAKEELVSHLEREGFKINYYEIIFKRRKVIRGKEKEFPIFLLIAENI